MSAVGRAWCDLGSQLPLTMVFVVRGVSGRGPRASLALARVTPIAVVSVCGRRVVAGGSVAVREHAEIIAPPQNAGHEGAAHPPARQHSPMMSSNSCAALLKHLPIFAQPASSLASGTALVPLDEAAARHSA